MPEYDTALTKKHLTEEMRFPLDALSLTNKGQLERQVFPGEQGRSVRSFSEAETGGRLYLEICDFVLAVFFKLLFPCREPGRAAFLSIFPIQFLMKVRYLGSFLLPTVFWGWRKVYVEVQTFMRRTLPEASGRYLRTWKDTSLSFFKRICFISVQVAVSLGQEETWSSSVGRLCLKSVFPQAGEKLQLGCVNEYEFVLIESPLRYLFLLCFLSCKLFML